MGLGPSKSSLALGFTLSTLRSPQPRSPARLLLCPPQSLPRPCPQLSRALCSPPLSTPNPAVTLHDRTPRCASGHRAPSECEWDGKDPPLERRRGDALRWPDGGPRAVLRPSHRTGLCTRSPRRPRNVISAEKPRRERSPALDSQELPPTEECGILAAPEPAVLCQGSRLPAPTSRHGQGFPEHQRPARPPVHRPDRRLGRGRALSGTHADTGQRCLSTGSTRAGAGAALSRNAIKKGAGVREEGGPPAVRKGCVTVRGEPRRPRGQGQARAFAPGGLHH